MKAFPFKSVLAVGAHCDDIEIGCGGVLLRLKEMGIPIHGLVITDTHYERNGIILREGSNSRREAENAALTIGYRPLFGDFRNNSISLDESLVYLIRDQIERHNVDTVFTHWDGDSHLDHVKTAQASIMATRDTRNLFMYKSNPFRTTSPFRGNVSFDISACWPDKLKALQCYQSEIRRVGPELLNWVENWNRLAGLEAGAKYAEPFVCVKSLF